MNGTAIRLVGGAVLVATVVLIGAVSYELAAFALGTDSLARVAAMVPLSETELVPLVVLVFGLLPLSVLFWLRGQSSNSQYNGDQ